eukprot:TRINITY_DN4030_c0_g1_i1.p1 TRINITY_DN4030_c0_g1~~TRINITY_DN4030_c0_g1_i1.p1  ORF type:complete len:347 (+),score=106.84 TRINITY_DN4030_c0_g1_i1:89-1129(+)
MKMKLRVLAVASLALQAGALRLGDEDLTGLVGKEATADKEASLKADTDAAAEKKPKDRKKKGHKKDKEGKANPPEKTEEKKQTEETKQQAPADEKEEEKAGGGAMFGGGQAERNPCEGVDRAHCKPDTAVFKKHAKRYDVPEGTLCVRRYFVDKSGVAERKCVPFNPDLEEAEGDKLGSVDKAAGEPLDEDKAGEKDEKPEPTQEEPEGKNAQPNAKAQEDPEGKNGQPNAKAQEESKGKDGRPNAKAQEESKGKGERPNAKGSEPDPKTPRELGGGSSEASLAEAMKICAKMGSKKETKKYCKPDPTYFEQKRVEFSDLPAEFTCVRTYEAKKAKCVAVPTIDDD